MKKLIFLLFIAFNLNAFSQQYSNDLNFNIGTGFDTYPMKSVLQSDGKIVLCGSFISYNGIARNRIIRLNADGSNDPTFNPGLGFNNQVNDIAIQSDGKILAVGGFTSFNGTTTNRIARLNSNGTIDATFNSGTGFNTNADVVNIQSDGKIIVVGIFLTYNGVSKNRIIRLSSTGAIDPTFNIGTGFNSNPKTIEIGTNGQILLGGVFTTYNGITANQIIRLNVDGSIDATFSSGSGTGTVSTGIFRSTKIQPDGKILVGGFFTSYDGTITNPIIRLNSDGTLDPTFITGSGFNTSNAVEDIEIQIDGKILVVGFFSSYNGNTANQIARLNTNGTIDATFYSGSGFDNYVKHIIIQPDGKILAVGGFTSYNNSSRNRVTRLFNCGNIIIQNQTIDTIACDSYISQTNQTYTQSGSYNEVIPNISGCDSVHRLINLTVLSSQPQSSSFAVGICPNNIYTWNNIDYSIPGQYQQVFSNQCRDSTVTLDLILLNSSDTIINASTCQGYPYVLNNIEYLTAGQYQQTFSNQFGCDSTITLNLSVINSTYSDQYFTICPTIDYNTSSGNNINWISEFLWALNNQVYNLSGTYIDTIQATSGCDSIVTLHLTFAQPPQSSTQYITACESYFWNAWLYDISSSPGDFFLGEFTSINGCDSLAFLQLTILPESSSSFSETICPGTSFTWNNQQYNTAGQYQQTLTNEYGCDSVVTLNLTILPNNFNPTFSSTQQLYTAPPFAVQFSNSTANASNYSFVWYWGDGTSSSSNNASVFHEYLYNGQYTVSLIATNNTTGCSDTTTITDYIYCTGGASCTHTATISQQGPLQACAGTDVWLSCNNDPSFSYQWRRDGVNIPGNNNDSLLVTQTGNYTVSIYVNNCPVTSNGVAVTITPLPAIPVITTSGNITSCFGGILTLNAPVGFSSYSWNTGATSANIDVTQSGSYFVTVENSGNCSSTSLPFVVNASFMSSPNVCIVGMDSLTNENRIVWEKPLTLGIDSFYVYKETNVSDVYEKIGATNYPDLAVFLDQNSNPAVQAYRYKLTVLDTCGTETLLSDFHKTIHLTINAGVGGAWNLIWSHYEGLTFGSYNIYRGTDPTNISLLTTIQSNLNSYTDLAPPVGPVYYQIEIVNPNSCDPTKVVNYSVSKSNIVNNGANGINTLTNSTVMVYPNPTMDDLTITSTDALYDEYIIFDPQGRKVLSGSLEGKTTQLDLSRLARGNYLLQIGENKTPIKLIKQ
jgi:uncharacterized delta-60 repeat protein